MNIDNIHEEDREEIMDVIRARLYRLDNIQMKRLSWSIKRSYSCLVSIRSGRTKWPYSNTLFPLLREFDLRLTIANRKAYIGPGKLTMSLMAAQNETMQ
jgi:hypothetical protein